MSARAMRTPLSWVLAGRDDGGEGSKEAYDIKSYLSSVDATEPQEAKS